MIMTACSSQSVDEDKISASEPETEELNALEEISKVCLESDIEACRETYNEKSDQIDEEFSEGKETIGKYLNVHKVLTSSKTAEEKLKDIESDMTYIKNKGYYTLAKFNRKLGNNYYADYLETVIQPKAQIYNSKKYGVGMEKMDLILSIGYPNDINKTTTSNNVSEQWVYDNYEIYIYLDNGIVSSFQN
ncbi:hypothetical protein ABXS71_06225 [Bacillus infantis]|uniref:hypothetical protein n=1 Tax=Bacillus infantis TaxID=324767 RepID=UPI00344DA708